MKKALYVAALFAASLAIAGESLTPARSEPVAIDTAAVESQVDARLHALLSRMAVDAQQKADRLAMAE